MTNPAISILSAALAAGVLLAHCEPVAAKFLSPDPVKADENTGENFNRYYYANNNPYRFTDPDGRAPKGCGDGTCSGVFISGKLEYRQAVHGRMEELRGSSPELAQRIDTLRNSDNAHRIVDSSRNPVAPGVPANVNLTSDLADESNGVGTGTTTYYNPDQRMTPEGTAFGSPQGVMAHEVTGHAYDKDQGKNDASINPGTGNSRSEERANAAEQIYVDSKLDKAK